MACACHNVLPLPDIHWRDRVAVAGVNERSCDAFLRQHGRFPLWEGEGVRPEDPALAKIALLRIELVGESEVDIVLARPNPKMVPMMWVGPRQNWKILPDQRTTPSMMQEAMLASS